MPKAADLGACLRCTRYEHYHWDNDKSIKVRRKLGETEKYIDRYGNVCADGSEESHLAPKDKTYNFRR